MKIKVYLSNQSVLLVDDVRSIPAKSFVFGYRQSNDRKFSSHAQSSPSLRFIMRTPRLLPHLVPHLTSQRLFRTPAFPFQCCFKYSITFNPTPQCFVSIFETGNSGTSSNSSRCAFVATWAEGGFSMSYQIKKIGKMKMSRREHPSRELMRGLNMV